MSGDFEDAIPRRRHHGSRGHRDFRRARHPRRRHQIRRLWHGHFIDELKKLTHPMRTRMRNLRTLRTIPGGCVRDRRSKIEDRRNKVVNIHATTQLEGGAGKARPL